ncbi:MAG: Glutathione S-transferase domain [Candidatus Binatus sp.]|nr:Glutathione S-transferase domain [Candidatus Binatus sp.]
MRLFTYATSPYARKARMVLEAKGVEFEPIERCYSLDRKEDLRSASPRAEVPVLVLDDGRTISDSTIICEYLEDKFPTPSLFPGDPFERARMRAIEDLCDRAFDSVAYGYWIAVLRKDAPEAEAMTRAARDEFSNLLVVLERELGNRDFFCDKLSVADIAAICYVPSAPAMGIALKSFPRLGEWVRAMRALPVVAADGERLKHALAGMHDIASELEGPDGKVHWRDSRLEWPLRHGFFEFVMREFKANKMMFPPDAA